MDERELQEQDLGVDAGDSTESAQQATAPVDAKPTAQPRVNLDELPEFRRFRSEYDRKLAEQERRYQQQLAQREAELRNSRLAEMDDYQRLEYELNEERQRAAAAYQRLQEVEVEQAKMRVLREVSAEMGVPVEAIAEAQDVADAWRLAAIKQRELQQQRETERQEQENRRVAERAGKIANNRVDLGTGTPVPANDWERTYLAAKARKDARSLFNLALKQQE
jgi:predicted ribosome quality control (RQC) complex YloA/Tae2 family protein